MRQLRSVVIGSVLLLAAPAAAPVMFVNPEPIPADRLIAHLEARLKKNPEDHLLVYTLARVHYLAFYNRSALVPGYGLAAGNRLAPRHLDDRFLADERREKAKAEALAELGLEDDAALDQPARRKFTELVRARFQKLVDAGWSPRPITAEKLEEHGREAVRLFDRAINLAPKTALYQLGRASLGERVLRLVQAGKLKAPLAGISTASVMRRYYRAFELAIEEDAEREFLPIAGMADLVSFEAGNAFLRLMRDQPERTGKPDRAGKQERAGKQGHTGKPGRTGKQQHTDTDKQRIRKVETGLARLRKLRRGAITPILVGSVADTRLDDLLDPGHHVHFDLDGDGVREICPWVRPDTGFLVWAPIGTERIESGRQLFGSVTFFLFHRDGYAALRLLDRDDDGELRDLELDGLAIWRDRDQDGESDPGELEPLLATDIVAIATRADGSDGLAPRSAAGVRFADGRTAPTIDWIVVP